MKNAKQKTFSLTEKHIEMLRDMAYKAGMKESRIIQTMIEIVNGSEINLWMIKCAGTSKNIDKSTLRIMSDGEKTKKAWRMMTYEERQAKPEGTGFNNSSITEEQIQRTIDIAKTRWID